MASKRGGRSTKGRKRLTLELGLGSIVIGCFGLFFLLSWIFVLGVLVGRGFIPETYTMVSALKKKVHRWQGVVSPEEGTSQKPSTEEPSGDPELAFYDRLSSKKDEAKRRGGERGQTRAISKAKPKMSPKTVTKTPVPSKEPVVKKIKPKEKVNQGGQYTIQVASLADKKKAEQLSNNLDKKGHAAYYYAVKVSGQTFYRVRCGRFRSKEDAARYADELARKERIKGFVLTVE
jgi:cell division septation protein DedD